MKTLGIILGICLGIILAYVLRFITDHIVENTYGERRDVSLADIWRMKDKVYFITLVVVIAIGCGLGMMLLDVD